jgi:hypothetical protein
LQMKRRWLRFVNAQLNDWYISFGKDVRQHGPCSVIQSP